ncbi:hypothetical protein [Ruminiclostridium cellobioparum]|nr:hypothetical protein [Ruminiclostridium cellobioparum]
MKYLEDILAVAGVGIIAVGVFLIYIPAGFIFVGACSIAAAYILTRGGD